VRVAVLGAGALGSLYGAWSADAGHQVVLVTRPAHVEAILSDGLTVRDVAGSERTVRLDAADTPAAAGDADVVLVACKSQDTAALLDAHPGRPRAAWSVQNGARQAEPLVRRYGPAAVGCSSMVGATLEAPGVITHTFGGATYIGALPTSAGDATEAVRDSLPADRELVERDDIQSVLWSKAVLAVGAMGVPVLLRLPYHHVFTEPRARNLFIDLVGDAAEVAAAEGVPLVDLPGPLQAGRLTALPRAEALARLEGVGRSMVAAGQTSVRVSMLQSLETGRPLEVEAVFGEVVALADRHGLAVPLLRTVTDIVRTLDDVIRRAQEPAAR
jgi:2-dehydropantoate 2-reductase